jgi:DNA-binding helix-turn-helix protein
MESKGKDERDELKVLCKNIYYLRKKNGLTQREMAERLNISLYSLRMIERGIIPKNLSCEILYYLQLHFFLDIADLFMPLEKN